MIFIGIAGPSAAGKTTLSNYLSSKYGNEFEHVRMDDYIRQPDTFPLKDGLKNWMYPGNLRFDLLYEHLCQLGDRQVVSNKTFVWLPGEQSHRYLLKPKKYILVEGVYVLLDESILSTLDLKIYLDVPVEVTLARRKNRDGSKFELDEFDRKITVPEYTRYGLIQKTQADHIIDGTQDPVVVANTVRDLIFRNKSKNHVQN